MKRAILFFLMFLLLFLGGINLKAQDQPVPRGDTAVSQPAPKKDTVNMDTYAKPQTYYGVEDEESMNNKGKGSGTAVIIIVAAIVIIGGIALILMRGKNKREGV
jgi:hypothetical protein